MATAESCQQLFQFLPEATLRRHQTLWIIFLMIWWWWCHSTIIQTLAIKNFNYKLGLMYSTAVSNEGAKINTLTAALCMQMSMQRLISNIPD